MKKLVILSAIAAGSLFVSKANAQVSIHFGINIPAHRVYVPAPPPPVVQEEPVYDDNVNVSDDDDYYYLPEVEAYYNVGAGCYYYNDGSSWVSCAYLPGAYRDYNWRTAVRYEVRAPRPYLHHDLYRQRWGGYMGDRGNWGHRFDRRPMNGYANRQGWSGDRDNWGRRPNPYDNRGNWGSGRDNRGWGNGNHDNRGSWGNGQQPNNGNHDNHGGWGNGQQPNNGNHDNHGGNGQPNNGGNWGGRPSNDGGHDRGNGGERFTQNRDSGRGIRRF